MKRYRICRVVAAVFASSLVLVGCQDAPKTKAKAKSVQSATPSVGREYGETLHGAISQAHEARKTLEQSSEKALGQAENPGE